jgi:hypothetical protein
MLAFQWSAAQALFQMPRCSKKDIQRSIFLTIANHLPGISELDLRDRSNYNEKGENLKELAPSTRRKLRGSKDHLQNEGTAFVCID